MQRELAALTLRAIIGHSSERMTQHYAGVRQETKNAAIDQLVERAEGR